MSITPAIQRALGYGKSTNIDLDQTAYSGAVLYESALTAHGLSVPVVNGEGVCYIAKHLTVGECTYWLDCLSQFLEFLPVMLDDTVVCKKDFPKKSPVLNLFT